MRSHAHDAIVGVESDVAEGIVSPVLPVDPRCRLVDLNRIHGLAAVGL